MSGKAKGDGTAGAPPRGFLFSRPVPAAEIRRLFAAAAMPWMAAT